MQPIEAKLSNANLSVPALPLACPDPVRDHIKKHPFRNAHLSERLKIVLIVNNIMGQ